MKNIFFKIMAGAAAISALASCNLNDYPAFNEADSFVAFDKTSFIIDETAGTVSLPITIASIDPVKTAITYEVVDGTAKEVYEDFASRTKILGEFAIFVSGNKNAQLLEEVADNNSKER